MSPDGKDAFLFPDLANTIPCNHSTVGSVSWEMSREVDSTNGTRSAQLFLFTTAAGIDKGEPIKFPLPHAGAASNDKLLLEHGIAFLGNRFEVTRIEDHPFRRALDDSSMIIPFPVEDVATFIRDADTIGPCWPGIPGPNATDIIRCSLQDGVFKT